MFNLKKYFKLQKIFILQNIFNLNNIFNIDDNDNNNNNKNKINTVNKVNISALHEAQQIINDITKKYDDGFASEGQQIKSHYDDLTQSQSLFVGQLISMMVAINRFNSAFKRTGMVPVSKLIQPQSLIDANISNQIKNLNEQKISNDVDSQLQLPFDNDLLQFDNQNENQIKMKMDLDLFDDHDDDVIKTKENDDDSKPELPSELTTPLIPTKTKTRIKSKLLDTEERTAETLNQQRTKQFEAKIDFPALSETPPTIKQPKWDQKIEEKVLKLSDFNHTTYAFCEIKPPKEWKADFQDLRQCIAFTRCMELIYFFILNN